MTDVVKCRAQIIKFSMKLEVVINLVVKFGHFLLERNIYANQNEINIEW